MPSSYLKFIELGLLSATERLLQTASSPSSGREWLCARTAHGTLHVARCHVTAVETAYSTVQAVSLLFM